MLLRRICLAPLGSTACIVYGQQELGMFSTHVGDTCLMPFHLYEGQSGRLIASALHPGKTPTAKAIIGILRRVVKKLRQVWPRLPLVFRADGHHSKPEVLAWLERMGLHYVIGYAPNAVLKKQFAACISQAAKRFEVHLKEGRAEVEARTFASSGNYSAGSWGGKARRIICRAIAGPSPGHMESMSGSSSPASKTPQRGSFTKTSTADADAPNFTSRTTNSAW